MDIVRLAEKMEVSAERFTKRIAFDTPEVLALVLTFAPGQSLPPHKHPGSAVLVHALTGTLTVSLGEESRTLTAGEVLLAQGENVLGILNAGAEPAAVFVTLSPNPSKRG